MKNALLCVTSALVLAWAASAHAQAPTAGNLEKLSDFKTTGTPMDIPQVPQTGAKAEAIKKISPASSCRAGSRSGSMPSCRMPVTSRSGRKAW